jgi:PAS domain S-box-containing protein
MEKPSANNRAPVPPELPLSEQGLLAIYDGIRDYVGLLSTDGALIEVNRAALEFAGCRREDVLGLPFWDAPWFAHTPGAAGVVRSAVMRAAAGEFVEFETDIVRPEGGVRLFRISFEPVCDPSGKVIHIIPTARNITERTHTETAERLLAAVVESSADGIITKNVEGIVTSWNRAAEGIFGYSAAEMIGRPLSVIAPRDRPDEMPALLARIRRGERVNSFETQRRTKDGRLIDISVTISPLHDGMGRIVGASKIVRDISDRKRIEKTLRENAEQLRLIADTAPVFIAHLDQEHRFKFVNEPYAARFGLRPEQIVGRRMAELLGSAGYETVRRRLEQAFGGEDVEFEVAVPYQTLGVKYMRCAYAPERDAAGEVIGIVAAIVDISERKRTEDALAARTEELMTLLDTLPAFVWTAEDPECRVITGNRAANALTGTGPGENISQTAPDGAAVYLRQLKEDGSEYRPEELPMQRALATGRPVREAFLDFRFPDGRSVQALGSAVPLFDGSGRVRGGIAAFMDITERRHAEKAVLEAKRAAEAANQSKDRFLAVLSHELRTPLTPVLMVMDELANAEGLGPEVREDLAMVQRNLKLEVKLIDDLLDLSRITSGKVELKTETVDLNAAVRQVCGICMMQRLEQDVSLEMELCAETAFIAADSARLQQVLWNVIKNAIKFTPAQGSVRITTARLSADFCEVRVTDTGIGIPADVLPRIFDAFEQGDAHITRQFGGLGLGLAISRALVDRHGGSIRAESPGPGQGATFVVEFPIQRSAPPAAPAAAPEAAAGTGKIRLLLVEDHADTARTLSRLLGAAGFATVTASDVAHALVLAGREPFDVLVSDLGLPDGDGYEIMRAIRANREVPGIAMSGYGMEEDVRRSREAGFAEHLVKPIDLPQLIAALRRVAQAQS